MIPKYNTRKWHAWISFAISLPILLVAISGIFIAHGQKLGFRDIKVNASWLPGYLGATAERQVRATLHTTAILWIGTQAGLFTQSADGIREIKDFTDQEIRALLHTDNTVFVLTTQGLFAQRDEKWQRVSHGQASNAYVDGSNLYIMTRDKGLQMSSDDGASWSAASTAAQLVLPPLGPQPAKMILARVIHDLHTGEAFLGHDSEWIWNDMVGGTMTFLGISGLYLWWRGPRRTVFLRR